MQHGAMVRWGLVQSIPELMLSPANLAVYHTTTFLFAQIFTPRLERFERGS
jgi:hypothetical protein